MPDDIRTLEQRAVELVKAGDFGPDAIEANASIAALAPGNVAAWTRLGRCHLEQRNWDAAIEALRTALALSPTQTVATNLLNEVRTRRARTPTAAQRATTGFSAREFAILETLSGDDPLAPLRTRIELLFDAINASSAAARIVEARQREGESGSKLFHANSCHPGAPGHVYAFHHGGRWEPQFNLGWFSSPPFPANCMRVGIGFNTSQAGRDSDRMAGQERVLHFFERFQRVVAKSWTRELAGWMSLNAGFIQFGDRPPAMDLVPEKAVEWIVNCRNAAALEWIFVGRWLFLDRPDDAKILVERAVLARVVDETFRALLPLWLSTYRTGAVEQAGQA